MKKYIFLVLLLSGALFMASCSNDEVDDATLALSELSLEFPKDAAEKNVTVTTNQQKWVAMANVEWIELEQAGQTLTVKTKVNANGAERSGTILVKAGGTSETIHVTQSASDMHIAIIPDKLEINQWGGERVFDVDANTDDWEVKTDATWITLTPKLYKKEVSMQIEENTERESRSATITIIANNTLKEFTVVQSGIMFFILPYMDFGADIQDVVPFEVTRNSTYVHISTFLLYFVTQSPVFYRIEYKTYGISDQYKEATVDIASDFITPDGTFEKELNAFFIENGFKKMAEEENSYSKDIEDYMVKAKVIIDGSEPRIDFSYIPHQFESYPTFDTFPYGLVDFKANRDVIMAWEQQHGGVYNTAESSEDNPYEASHLLWFDVPDGTETLCRAYFIERELHAIEDERLMTENVQFFTNKSRCFWEHKGLIHLTKEFVALMASENFVFFDSPLNWHIFVNYDTEVILFVQWKKYEDESVPVIDMRISSIARQDAKSLAKYLETFDPKTMERATFRGK